MTTPDVLSRNEIQSKTGFVAIQQTIRDAMSWLSGKFKYQGGIRSQA